MQRSECLLNVAYMIDTTCLTCKHEFEDGNKNVSSLDTDVKTDKKI